MIHLTKGNTEDIYLTLTEHQTLVNPFFVFVFKQRTTGAEVKFTKNTDSSPYPSRYNKFNIVVNTYFKTASVGEWIYQVFESATNTTTTTNLNLLEEGIMILHDTGFAYTSRKSEFIYVTK